MRLKHGFLLVMVFFWGMVVPAQEPVKDSIQLEGVEIKSRRLPQESRSSEMGHFLTAAKLKGIAGSSVAEAIKILPGVTLTDYGGIGGLKTVIVRSLSAHHTAVYVDGIAFSDMASGQIDLGKIPLIAIENINLRIGHSSQMCQPARALLSASSINLETKSPDFGKKTFKILGGLKAGSFGLVNPYLITGLKISPKTTLFSNLNGSHAHGRYPFAIDNLGKSFTTKRNNSDITATQFNLLLDHITRDSARLKVRTNYYDSERGLPGAVILYNPYSQQRLWNRDLYTSFQYWSPESRKLRLHSNLTYARSFLKYLDPVYPNLAGKLESKFEQQEFYLSQATSVKASNKLGLAMSSDLMIHTLKSDQYKFSNPLRISWLTAFSTNLKINRFDLYGSVLTYWVHEKNEKGQAIKNRFAVNPALEMSFNVSRQPGIRARLLYKSTTRMPTFNDLYYSFTGNSGLRPEIASQLNLGLLFSHTVKNCWHFSVTADGFYNQVKDKIIAVPTQQLFVWSMRNVGLVDIRGVELQAIGSLPFSNHTELSLSGNYTLQYASDRTQKGTTTYKHQLPYIPFETLSSSLMVEHRQFLFSYNVLFNGFRYSLGQNIAANKLPAWWQHDSTFGWKISSKMFSCLLKAQVSNLFNKQYEVIRSFPMPGRAIYITAEINY